MEHQDNDSPASDSSPATPASDELTDKVADALALGETPEGLNQAAAALAVMDIITQERLVENAAARGAQLKAELADVAAEQRHH